MLGQEAQGCLGREFRKARKDHPSPRTLFEPHIAMCVGLRYSSMQMTHVYVILKAKLGHKMQSSFLMCFRIL